MSIFPFISPEMLENGQVSELPMFREYAYDFENNCLLLRDGNTYLVEGNEALRIWIFKALTTERFRYTAYDSAFGSEIHTLIGSSSHSDIVKSELKRFIKHPSKRAFTACLGGLFYPFKPRLRIDF